MTERQFWVAGANGPVPGMLWTASASDVSGVKPMILLGHGGSGSKNTANILDARDYFTGRCGIATAAIDGPAHGDRGPVTTTEHPEYSAMWARPNVIEDMNIDWARTLDALLALGEFDANAVGFHGLSMGSMFGIPYVAAEPRIAVAVLGLCGYRGTSIDRSGIAARLAEDAPRITCPLVYHVQWDDERFERESAFELYGQIASVDKRLQSTPGGHGGISTEGRDTLRAFLVARLEALHAGTPQAAAAR